MDVIVVCYYNLFYSTVNVFIIYFLLYYYIIALRKQVIPIFLTQVVARISESLSKVVFKVMLLEVIETCIGFEPILSIEFLNNLNVLEPVYNNLLILFCCYRLFKK